MSRKKPKKQMAAEMPVLSTATQTPTALSRPERHYRLEDVQEEALRRFGELDWQALQAMADLPVERFILEDQKEAAIWLARVHWIAVSEAGDRKIGYLAEERRAELNRRLQASADALPTFFQNPEFVGYLDSFRYSAEDSLHLYHYLLRVCDQIIDMRWIARLRDRSRRLLIELQQDDEDRDGGLALLSEKAIFVALSGVYTRAEKEQSLTELDHALLTILRAELEGFMLEPWEMSDAAGLLRTLESPTPDEMADYAAAIPQDYDTRLLSPVALAFIWELASVDYRGFPTLLAKYPVDFGCDVVTGLRRIVESVLCPPGQVDALLLEGVQLLTNDHNNSRPWLGESLLVKTSTGIQEVRIEPITVFIPKEVYELLLHLLENAPAGYQRSAELEAFYRLYAAAARYEPLEDEDNGDINMPGLAWLCEQCLAFQFLAAGNIQGVGGRTRLVLDGIRRAAVTEVDTPHHYFSGDLTDEPLEQDDVDSILHLIYRILPFRDDMTEQTEHMWLQVAPNVFKSLSHVDGYDKKDVLQYARYCEKDLLAKGCAFTLGYLEQVAGSPESALRHYLYELDTAKELNPSTANNVRLLWAKEENMDTLISFIEMLKEAAATNSRSEDVRALLKGAKARQDVLNKQNQFERTAVNRWPSVTAPARKLLGVLSNIQRFKNFGELAEYAGMRADWAEKHYDKLVETGMLLLSKDGYSINPHIQPMLELESQHSVVGRIVRSQGTSAVKQVFNSQREFTIYQVMVQLCPNHLVFPNSSLQSIMSYEKMKELVDDDAFSYYLRASVDIVVVSSSTYLPMLAIEVDSIWHDTERQQTNDGKKDRLFSAAGIPFMRLRPVGTPSENVIRGQVAEHLDDLIRTLRVDLPGYDQARILLEDLSGASAH